MEPDLKDYKILYMNGAYMVLDPYDLYCMPCVKIYGGAFHDLKYALQTRVKLFEAHNIEYERLKLLGRSFPDND